MDIFKNKVLLITGGTGSFGDATAKKLLDTSLKEIRIFSRDEKKQFDMKNKYNNEKLKFYIGDVRDKKSVDNVMNGVDYVFHAAAMKHVPICEEFPEQAFKTNVEGTLNVLDSAIENEVKKVIVLSTDKAVYPISTMGITKALAEKIAENKGASQNKTIICRTRFGNVMGSRGSVIPLFVKQIKEGRDITITNKDMTRYMMSINDAVELVLYAFNHGKQGDLFVQKAPSSNIYTLAIALKQILNADNDIKIIGARKGENMHETLVSKQEMCACEDCGNYYRINTSESYNLVDGLTAYTSYNTDRLDVEKMKNILIDNKLVDGGM